jgi:hypothetical protein
MSYGRQRENDWPGAWGPVASMMAPWVQITRMWIDCLGGFAPGASGTNSPWADPSNRCGCGCGGRCRDHGYGASAFASSQVPIQVRSERKVSESLNLRPGAECERLGIVRMRRGGTERDSAESTQVRAVFDRQEGFLRLRIEVDRTSEEGAYCGDVFDDCGGKCGEVMVEVGTAVTRASATPTAKGAESKPRTARSKRAPRRPVEGA